MPEEHPSRHILTTPCHIHVHFYLSPGWQATFQSTIPGKAAGTCHLALAPWADLYWLSGKHGQPSLQASLKLSEPYKRVKISTCLTHLQARSLLVTQDHLPGTPTLPSKPSNLRGQGRLPEPSGAAGTWDCTRKYYSLTMHTPFFLNPMTRGNTGLASIKMKLETNVLQTILGSTNTL